MSSSQEIGINFGKDGGIRPLVFHRYEELVVNYWLSLII